jgi:hypothetical protein
MGTDETSLRVIDGIGRDRHWVLRREARRLTIGRRACNEIAIEWDQEVSRVHAELVASCNTWFVVDDGLSRNGTYVNEVRILGRRRLVDGDMLRIGCTRMVLSDPHEATWDAPTIVGGELPLMAPVSSQQQEILEALCAPMLVLGPHAAPRSDAAVALATNIALDVVASELDQIARRLGFEASPHEAGRADVAAAALRLGLVDVGPTCEP